MTAKKADLRMAPVLQSMQDYISNHFSDELMDEVEAGISLNLVEGLELDTEGAEVRLNRHECKIVRAELWRMDRTKLLADIRMRIKVAVARGDSIPRSYMRHVNFSAELTLDGGIILHKGIRDLSACCLPERVMPKLSKYLVPILTYDEMEVQVLEMLRKYVGDSATTIYQENGAARLAEAMGLSLMYVSLYKNTYTSTILFLKESKVRVVASEATGIDSDSDDFTEITVPAKTILVNQNRLHASDIDREIYHECGHYEWHSMFFELQELHSADLRLLEYKEVEKASKPAEKDVRWVERQASFVGVAAMFPRPVISPMFRNYWAEVANSQDNLGQKIATIIFKMSADKQKSKSLIKTRLVTLGCTGAKGACNFVDGKYIQPFAFNPENLGPSETFVISRAQFTSMYEQDEDFRNLINTHQFIYADGHVCCNMPQFVRQGDKGMYLTQWALGHVDECCLKFKKSYQLTNRREYRVGELHSDQDYNEAYLMIHTMEIAGMSIDEVMEKNLDYLDEFPHRPSKAITKLIQDRAGSQKELALNSGLSTATINRMCKDDDFQYTIQEATRIIVGLKMPPPLSALFLDIIGFTRTVMVRHYRYQCIIDCLFMDDIYQIVDTHKSLFEK